MAIHVVHVEIPAAETEGRPCAQIGRGTPFFFFFLLVGPGVCVVFYAFILGALGALSGAGGGVIDRSINN